MSRLIDAELLKAGFEEDGHLSPYIEGFIDACPTVDPVKRSKWISVKDRLPEAVEDVLVCSKRGIGIGCYFGSTKLWANDSFHSWEITHWMPLPEPPKEEA